MTKENPEEQTTALALSGKQLGNHLSVDLFKDIDFQSLNAAIDSMGDASTELEKDEKEAARGIIDEWTHGVINKLRQKTNEMDSFLYFFNPSNASTRIGHMELEEFGLDLATKTGTVGLYEEVVASEEELFKHINNNIPVRPINGKDTTFEEDVVEQGKYKVESKLFSIESDKLKKINSNKIGQWKRALNETQTVKDLLVESRKFKRGANKMHEVATEKSQLAKLNISVSSKSARESIRSLLDFTTNI